MKNKKGAVVLYFLIIALILSVTTILLYTAPTDEETKFVGATQQKLLLSQENKNQAINFLDMATNLATKKTVQDLNENSGFNTNYFLVDFPCERVIYPILNEGTKINCFPNFNESIQTNYELNFDKLLMQNPDILFLPSDFDITTTKSKEDITMEIKTINAVSIPIYQSFSNYQDEKTQNFISSGAPKYSYDKQNLVPIANIPNIICNEKDTSFGKICAGNQELIDALKKMSQDYLVPEERTMIITQAYRTYPIQKALYDHACKTDGCQYGCNPDTNKACPHMVAGAIDMNIVTKDGQNLNYRSASKESKEKIMNLMCDYGFVNYALEPWHFEYGTRQWEIAMQKRQGGERACQYPFK